MQEKEVTQYILQFIRNGYNTWFKLKDSYIYTVCSTSYNLQQQLKKVTEESTVHVATFKK